MASRGPRRGRAAAARAAHLATLPVAAGPKSRGRGAHEGQSGPSGRETAVSPAARRGRGRVSHRGRRRQAQDREVGGPAARRIPERRLAKGRGPARVATDPQRGRGTVVATLEPGSLVAPPRTGPVYQAAPAVRPAVVGHPQDSRLAHRVAVWFQEVEGSRDGLRLSGRNGRSDPGGARVPTGAESAARPLAVGQSARRRLPSLDGRGEPIVGPREQAPPHPAPLGHR